MIEVEEQLRHEMLVVAQRVTAESIRPLRVPPPRRSRRVRLLAPVVAAAAVAGLIVGVTVAGHHASKLPAGLTLPAGAPRYYVTLDNVPRDGTKFVVEAVVRASANGAPISSVQLLQSRGFPQPLSITGAANDRAFLITVPRGLEILRIAADGHVLGLTQLPRALWALSVYGATGDSVLSPDGNEVVVPIYQSFGTGSVARPCASCASGIAMFSMTTGVTTKWLLAGTDKAAVLPVNWPGDGHEVFVSVGLPAARYRLLDVARPGGSLLADSRPVRGPDASARPAGNGEIRSGSWLLPDEKTLLSPYLVFGTLPPPASTKALHATARIVETSAGTGMPQGLLYAASRTPYYGGLACYPESMGARGVHVLLWCLGSFGRLDGSHFTPLPGSSTDLKVSYGAAW